MTLPNALSHQADEIFKTGTETLIEQSSNILVGPVSNYQKDVVLLSQPESEGVELKWIISGQLENSRALKGRTPSWAIKFSKAEQSIILPRDLSTAEWEDAYGELSPKDLAVIFFDHTSPDKILKVLPSDNGERDLVTLVSDIVPIQANNDSVQRTQQWLTYLKHTRLDEGRKAALRTLIQVPVKWADLEHVIEHLILDPQVGNAMKVFIFGIVTFAVTENMWEVDNPKPVNFLCQMFSTEKNTNLTLQYLLNIKKVLSYSYDETTSSMSKPAGQQILVCLKRQEALGSLELPIQQQYQQIHDSYPKLLQN